MDSLTLFGLFAVTAMLIFYALEDRSPWFILAFAGRLCPWFGLWLPTGRVAVWGGRGHMDWRSHMALESKDDECLEVQSKTHIKRQAKKFKTETLPSNRPDLSPS